jgi:predicted glycoside hydrolase/deacetylase ChbG (UPF0249 family)
MKTTAYFAADDWGLSPAINAGILELAQRGWLRSVSLMANAPFLTERLDELLAFQDMAFSLHLNFTYGKPLEPAEDVGSLVDALSGEFYSHRRLILRGFSGRLRPEDVLREFEAQLRRLRCENVPVTGVDGHHHVHLLPGVAGPLHDALLRRGLSRLRMMTDRRHRASYLQTMLFKHFIAPRPRSSALSFEECRYLLPRDLRSRADFHGKLRAAGTAPLLVHPALYNDFADSGMLDQLQNERVHEFKSILKYLND